MGIVFGKAQNANNIVHLNMNKLISNYCQTKRWEQLFIKQTGTIEAHYDPLKLYKATLGLDNI